MLVLFRNIWNLTTVFVLFEFDLKKENNECHVNFLQNSSLAIQQTYSNEFSISQNIYFRMVKADTT